MGKFCWLTAPLKCPSIPLAVSSAVRRLHPLEAVVAEARDFFDLHSELDSYLKSHDNEARGEVGGVTCHNSELAATCSTEELKETLRRQRIGLANKGKVPWNKGRKHSPETRARISEKTLEAMRDPKIRQKMSETPRLHSEQSKQKIASSLRKLWAERLKWERAKEKFHSSWAVSIAEAAKRGGIDEEQLNWDSYERLKVEMAFSRLKWDEEKARKKKMKRSRADKNVQNRVQNMTRLAQKKSKPKQNDKLRVEKKRKTNSKRIKEKGELAVVKELNITDKLVKRKKSIDGPSSSQTGAMGYLQSALEKFDIESIKAEQRRSTVSLADQIQAAKSKRRSSTITSSP